VWGWRDFLRLSRGIAQIDGSGPIRGAEVPLDAATLTALVRSAGGDLVDDVFHPSRFDLESDAGVRAVSELVGLSRDTITTPSRRELAKGGPVGLFVDGRLGMFVGTRDDLPRLRATPGLRFDVEPLPSLGSQASVSRMSAFCINLKTHALGPAADFVAFAVSDEGSRIAARSGEIVPSTLDIVHDPVFTQPQLPPRSSYVYATSIRRSEPMPYVPSWDRVAAELEATLRALVRRRDVDLRAKLQPRLERFDERSAALFPGGS
jgi:multiple sugar transport system substrate-binding protein